MADSTEVREWAKANGYDVQDRGKLRTEIITAYDEAHTAPDPSMGVTEADFPPVPDDEPGEALDESTARANARNIPRERKPRVVKGRAPAKRGWRDMWKPAPGARKGPRADLSEFAEDTWTDLAMIMGGIPPVSRVLGIQAPYVGAAFDEAVKAIPLVDTVLQPVARYSVSLRALNGMFGPPLMVFSICAAGTDAWEHRTGPDGKVLIKVDEDGWYVPTPRTNVQLGMLRYSLLQMTRVADIAKVAERAIENAERMRSVDTLIASIFGFPQRRDHPESPAPPDGSPGPGQDPIQPTAVIKYPPPPQMDGTGMPRQAADAP